MKRLQAKLTYANVVSSLCLFLLIGGGTAFAADQLAAKSVGTKQLKKNAVTAAKLKKNAVTTAKIKNGAVTTEKIRDGAITGGKIAAGAISTSNLAGAITGSQIADGTITGSKIAAGTITGANINAPSTPFSQVVARLRAGARQPFETEGLYPIGSYTQAAGEDDQYIGSVSINFSSECTGEREVETVLLRDAPQDLESLEAAIPYIVGAAVIRENEATEETDRTLEFASLAGSGSMSSLASTTAAQHSLEIDLLRGHCGTGSGITVTGSALDVIGTR